MTNRPMTNNRDEWKAYWKEQGEEWRTEPEVDEEQQAYLKERLAIPVDYSKGVHPFKDIRLSRADIEWLLHKLRPIYWTEEIQTKQQELDLSGALIGNVETEPQVDLYGLPLAHVVLTGAHLEGANLCDVHLEGVSLSEAHLERGNLTGAHLEGADLIDVHLQDADLSYTYLEKARLTGAYLERTRFISAHLEGADLQLAHLEGAILTEAHLEGADLQWSHLEGVRLFDAHLESTILSDEDFQRIRQAKRNVRIHVSQQLPPTNLQGVFFDSATQLSGITLGNKKQTNQLADIQWGSVNLAVIEDQWRQIEWLGDETVARTLDNELRSSKLTKEEGVKKQKIRTNAWLEATRAYRQVSIALKNQGMNEIADRFAYRARVCQRHVSRHEHSWGNYIGSWILEAIAGYGYRPVRSLLAYVLVILLFASIYFVYGAGHLSYPESVVVSMTAFHGRGFFAQQFSPGDPQAYAAAIEAFFGLFIEVTFIATFSRRFFGD